MKKLAKLMSVMLSLVLIFSALVCVSAAPVNEVIGLSADVSSVKESGKVTVAVKALADFSFTNIEFELTYDKDNFAIVYENTSFGGDFADVGDKISLNPSTKGVIKATAASAVAKNIAKDTALFTVVFAPKDGAAQTGDVAADAFGLNVAKLNSSGTAVAEAATGAITAPITIKHEHDFVTYNASESVAPGCESGGTDRYYCACGEYEDRPVSENGHDYSGEWTPVAGEENWYKKDCGNCSVPLKTYVPAVTADDELGVSVEVPKGAFSEKVTVVIDKENVKNEDKINENLSSQITDKYLFDVKFVNDAGDEVVPATGADASITITLPDNFVGNNSAVGFYGNSANDIETLFEGTAVNQLTLSFNESGSFVVAAVIPPVSSDTSSDTEDTSSKVEGDTSSKEDTSSESKDETSSEPLISKPSSTDDKTDSTSSEKPAVTGDTSFIWIAVLAALVAVLALALTFVLGRKKQS